MSHISPEQLSNNAKQLFKLMEFDENEVLICEIRKHGFGLFVIYLIGALISLALLVATIALTAVFQGDPIGAGVNTSKAQPIIILLGGLLFVLTVIATAIAGHLYTSDVVLVTSEKISQFLHRTIFDRKISQLSIGDVQDVTVSQIGLFSRLFNYGTMVIETAGEQQNYTFIYTPFPYERAKDIVFSHEENLKRFGN